MRALKILATAATAAVITSAASAEDNELRIGYLTTNSGPAAVIGEQVVNGWKLGLEHEGWMKDGDKLGGVPTRIFYGDDQLKPDMGLREVDKFIKRDRVDMVAGFMWSNVMLAAKKPLIDNKIVMMSNVAGASPLAGKDCTPYFISTSWNNDQTAVASGTLLNDDKIKTAWAMAPNYQAGKDVINGFRSGYKGKVIGETLFKLGESDFQPDLSKVRSEKPEAVFFFGPGAMGISFLKQWAASGLSQDIKLYTLFTVDWISLPVIGDAALGTYHTNQWDIDSKDPVNQKFVKDYVAKYGKMPAHYAQQAYDGPRLIAAALRANGGKKYKDSLSFVKAMRHTPFPSARGPYTYNVNGIPVQNFYKREVVRADDGKLWITTRGIALQDDKDPFWQQCPAPNRL